MPWPAPRCCRSVCWARSPFPDSLPPAAEGLDWFGGMGPAGEAQLRAAVAGRAALEEHLASTEFDPEQFTPADHAALEGAWAGWAPSPGEP